MSPPDSEAKRRAPSGPETNRLDPPRARNQFRGNDFRDAELLDVAFVAGIDMERRFPDDEAQVRVAGFQRRLAKVWAPVDLRLCVAATPLHQ